MENKQSSSFNMQKGRIGIQGLSGTGKTELLMHKLKELYVSSDSKVVMTCYNRILERELSERIPAFFDTMKVQQQIKWNERLWCFRAGGHSLTKTQDCMRKFVIIMDYLIQNLSGE